MALPALKESYAAGVNVVTLGATRDQGGTRSVAYKIGGAKTLPFMDTDGATGEKLLVAMDVLDIEPDWPDVLKAPYGAALKDPAAWAKKCVEEFGADLICLKLDGTDPDGANRSGEEAVATVKTVLGAVGVPLVVWGCGIDAKDNEVMPKVSAATKGERCLLGPAKQENYKRLAASCIADGHNIICLAPLDINIAKQVNTLVTEMELPADRIVMFQTSGALGYGIEYAYSIQERQRLAALAGDKMMMMPVICDVGYESWRAKEAKSSDAEAPEWGAQAQRGPMWETASAIALVQAGADIIRMRHPKAVAAVKKALGGLQG
ncbi:MAG: acetyl-CoA decarbonylase/synthase complex subunit delta [Planctomycetes bacterium]|nr:acetyl-CoA decarbonylase/synthase complex subunit delta [Planctomycetota bacterium]